MSVENKLKEIVAEQLDKNVADLTLESSFIDDLNADSLDIVELVMAMEEAFDIEISDDDAEKIRTVGDALKYISDNS